MTLEIDETMLASTLDGMKKMADSKSSSANQYRRMYDDYLSAYSEIGLYITTLGGKHAVMKSNDL